MFWCRGPLPARAKGGYRATVLSIGKGNARSHTQTLVYR